ncbi:MAG: DUF1844 domain-containing protein [Candidatus Rokubacteria bacterium]|nr:DUF1844 domain-containing protein [Candidatus Rokubacteria bacterium]
MADEAENAGFTVRDRRQRDDADVAPTVRTSPTPPPGRAERNLVGLFMMLASLAAAALGEMPEGGGEVERDPEQATGLIDVLMLLREKTEGRRTAEETQVLDELLYDLQLRWVNAQKPSGR